MTMNDKPRLCGGTFFDLLLQAKKQRTSARKKALGDTDGLSDSDVLLGLIHIANPEHQNPAKEARDSFRTKTSEYKSCRTSSGSYLPFDDAEFARAFDQRIHTQYTDALSDMISFTETFINSNRKGAWLVTALLELIESDETLQNDELFYMGIENHPLSKSDLKTLTEVSLQPFLLAVWHYIILNRPDNKVGRSTFNSWHESSAILGAKREFISSIGQNPTRAISMNILDFSDSIENVSESWNYSADIAPEFTGDPLYIVTGSKLGITESADDFEEYLENAFDKYQTIKTLLYSDSPKPFYDFYVCNTLTYKVNKVRNSYEIKTIRNVTADILGNCTNFVIITGTGGLGKSMMMRHLLLDCIKQYETTQKLPIFIPLKDFDDSYNDLTEYVYEKFDSLGGNKEPDEFEEILADGRCLLLFDGFDEIHSSVRKLFEKKLDIFADTYSSNMFVISSRPAMSFIAFNRFTVFELKPFDKLQALSLIDKLEFRTDEPAIKATFRKKLDEELYFTHREFAENPLLLTIMLMTFEQFAEVPSKMHIFYREAYLTLSQKHDATKGAYKRALSTCVTADRFSEYFAEFCARTYYDEKFDFTDDDFKRYFNDMTEPSKDNNTASSSDFITDLVSNMCLMYQESRKYHFTHRSFQEYFCAMYFSKQKDKSLGAIGDMFENKRSRFNQDKTFNMLYDMIPEKIEEYVFLPYMQKLFAECDTQDGYWTFLQKIYPTIQYDKGDADSAENEPESFLFNFISNVKSFQGVHLFTEFPEEDDFITGEWCQLDDEYMRYDPEYHGETILKDDIPWEYTNECGFEDPDIIGYNYEFDVKTIYKNREKYSAFAAIIESDYFDYKEEYEEARNYLEELLDKQTPKSQNLFDLFQ